MATKKKPAAKPAKKTQTASNKGAKKAAPAKKSVATKSSKKATPAKPVKKAAAPKPAAKKAAPKKATPAKAIVKKAAPVKKAAATKKVDSKKTNQLKKTATTSKKTTVAKAAPAKKAATAKKAAPAKKAVPAPKPAAKKAAPAPAKKAAPAPALKAAPKKAEPVKKAAPAPTPAPAPAPVAVKKAASAKKSGGKQSHHVTKTVTTFAKGALPNRPLSASAAAAMQQQGGLPTKQATPAPRNVEKKPNVIVAHRRLENKAKQKDDAGKTMINYQPEFTRSILDEAVEMQGPVYRYSDEELNEFKELILARLEKARKELTYQQGLITRKDEAGTEDTENRYMNMEDGSGAMEREQLAQLASRQIQFINHLEKALMRIENKTYGICRVTGKLIDKARLRAVPHATLSIEAKNVMSKK